MKKTICILLSLCAILITGLITANAERYDIRGNANEEIVFFATVSDSGKIKLQQDGKGIMKMKNFNTTDTKNNEMYAEYTIVIDNGNTIRSIEWDGKSETFSLDKAGTYAIHVIPIPANKLVTVNSDTAWSFYKAIIEIFITNDAWESKEWISAPTWYIASNNGCMVSADDPREATIYVYYYSNQGVLLYQETLKLKNGSHTIKPSYSNPKYALDGTSTSYVVKVTNGRADTDTFAFFYKETTAGVEIRYLTQQGKIIKTEQKVYEVGNHEISPSAKTISNGGITYKLLTPERVNVTVNSDGTCWPNPVIFYFTEESNPSTSTGMDTSSNGQFYIWVKAGDTARIRNAPTSKGEQLGEEREGTRLTAYARVSSQEGGKDWYRISYNGKTAYVSTTTTSTSKPTITKTPVTTIPNKNTSGANNTSGNSNTSGTSNTSGNSSSKTATSASTGKKWEWGEWTTTRQTISNPNTMKEETRFRYGWWAAKCKNCGQHNPYWGSNTKCINCKKYLPRENVTSVYAYTDDKGGTQTIFGRNGGRYINSLPYWRESGDNDRTEYRYAVLVDKPSTK